MSTKFYQQAVDYFDEFTGALETFSNDKNENSFNKAKQFLTQMNINFCKAKTTSVKEKNALATKQQALLVTKSKMENEIRTTKREEEMLQVAVSNAKRNLEYAIGELQRAQQRYDNSSRKLSQMRREYERAKKKQRDMQIAAAATSWIPFVGLTLAVISITAERDAVNSARGRYNIQANELNTQRYNQNIASRNHNQRTNTLRVKQNQRKSKNMQLQAVKSKLGPIEDQLTTTSKFLENTKVVSVHFATVFNRSDKANSYKEQNVEKLLRMLNDTAKSISSGITVHVDQNKIQRISNTLKNIGFTEPDKLEEILDDVDLDDW